MGDKTDIIDRAVKKSAEEREFDFMAFENKWLKKIGSSMMVSAGAIVIVLVAIGGALYQLNGIDDALAGKVNTTVHSKEHETDSLRVFHVEQAIVDLVDHAEKSDKRIEDVNYYLQQQQDVKFTQLLEAIRENSE